MAGQQAAAAVRVPGARRGQAAAGRQPIAIYCSYNIMH